MKYICGSYFMSKKRVGIRYSLAEVSLDLTLKCILNVLIFFES